MSADTTPISPARFAAAVKDLSVEMLHIKVIEIRNSIAHLQYSNDQLRPFAEGAAVVLGDNLLQKSIKGAVDAFKAQPNGARILLKEVPDAERFGVAELNGDRIVGIEEKPKHPKSNLAVTGIYMYDASVFDKIKTLKPSNRGELEITDVNNAYIREGTLAYSVLDGWWTDAGTFDSLRRAANLVADSREETVNSLVAGSGV